MAAAGKPPAATVLLVSYADFGKGAAPSMMHATLKSAMRRSDNGVSVGSVKARPTAQAPSLTTRAWPAELPRPASLTVPSTASR